MSELGYIFHQEAIIKIKIPYPYLNDQEKRVMDNAIYYHKTELKKYNSDLDLKDITTTEYNRAKGLFIKFLWESDEVLKDDTNDVFEDYFATANRMGTRHTKQSRLVEKLYHSIQFWYTRYQPPQRLISAIVQKWRTKNNATPLGLCCAKIIKREVIESFIADNISTDKEYYKKELNKIIINNPLK